MLDTFCLTFGVKQKIKRGNPIEIVGKFGDGNKKE